MQQISKSLFALVCVLLFVSLVSGIPVEESTTTKEGELVTIVGRDYYFALLEEATWEEAAALCSNMSMILVSFETGEEYEAVMDHISNTPGHDFWMWTSGTQTGGATWTWDAIDVPFDDQSTFWLPGEPSDSDTGTTCMNFSVSYGGWDDDQCDMKMSYLCEQNDMEDY